MTDQLWTRAQVANLLQISVEVFYRTRRDLEAKGLPAPVFGKGKGERWDPEEIRAWLKRRRDAKQLAEAAAGMPGTAPDGIAGDDEVAARLDARAAILAQGGRA